MGVVSNIRFGCRYAHGLLIIALCSLSSVLGACTSVQEQFGDATEPTLRSQDQILAGYALGANDLLRVNVFGQTEMSGDFRVSGAGDITLPLAGSVIVSGGTARDAENAIKTRLIEDELMRDPRVSVDVVEFRPYYIMGEVASPGEYPFSSGLTIVNAVARAKGFTYRANVNRVWVKHAGAEAETLYKVTPNMLVEPGDTIRVPERLF